jgi:hypothetical protein
MVPTQMCLINRGSSCPRALEPTPNHQIGCQRYWFFQNKQQIIQQDCIPKPRGSLDLANSAAHPVSRSDTLFVTAKLSPFLRTDSPDCVRTCSDKLRTNFLDPWVAFGVTVIWWRCFRAKNFWKWISFCLRKLCLKELSTATRMWRWSDWFSILCKRFVYSTLASWSINIGSYLLVGCLLACKIILEDQWLRYGAFSIRPFGTMSFIGFGFHKKSK